MKRLEFYKTDEKTKELILVSIIRYNSHFVICGNSPLKDAAFSELTNAVKFLIDKGYFINIDLK